MVRESSDGRLLEAMTWGLVPSWAKDPSGARPINARAETIFDKPMFRNAIRRRRCLIPADGFYEWRTEPQRKQPYHIGMVDGALFAFAGIWEYWARAPEEPRVTCAIIVTQANELMARIHERMPVIIAPEDYARWLDPECGSGLDHPYACALPVRADAGARGGDSRQQCEERRSGAARACYLRPVTLTAVPRGVTGTPGTWLA